MKKIINGLKKIMLMLGSFVLTVYTKVSATALSPYEFKTDYPTQSLYGVPRTIPMIGNFAKVFIISIDSSFDNGP